MHELVSANATVAAGNFNPTVFNQHWLVLNQVLSAEDLQQPGSIFTDMIVQAQGRDFTLVVLPQQFVIVARTPATFPGAQARETVGRIGRLLSHTPFIAIGLNFVWQTDPVVTPGALSRDLFAKPSGLYGEFASEDSRFGAYLSKDVGPVRMRLDIRPIHDNRTVSRVERLQFTFNFERSLQDEAEKADVIEETAGRWDEYRAMSDRIVRLALGEPQ